jgi:hypothetical protein
MAFPDVALTSPGGAFNISLGAAAIDLYPQEGAQVQAGDSAALTQVHVLAPVEGVQTNAGDQAALTQVHELAPAEGAQIQAGDSAAIAVSYNLQPIEGVQEQAGDAAALTQQHNLAPVEGAQTQAGDVAALVQQHNLVPAEGVQVQAGDVPALTQQQNLQAEEGWQVQVGDSPALTQQHDLLAQEGVQAQLGDSATIQVVSGIDLHPDEGAQGQFGDGASLIVGVLTTYEFVDRLLLEERIKTRRLAEKTIKLRVEPKVADLRLGCLSAPPGPELLLNGGFNSWTGGEPDNWNARIGGVAFDGYYWEETTEKVEGSSSIGIFTGGKDLFTAYQQFNLAAGDHLRLSAWLMAGANGMLYVSVARPDGWWLHEDGTWGPTDTGTLIAVGPTFLQPAWTLKWTEFTAPASGVYTIQLRNGADEANVTHFADGFDLFEVGVRGFIEKARLHDKTRIQQLGRFQ